MNQPQFRGFNLETNSWHYGHGWFEIDYTEEYKQEKGIKDKACLYTDGSPVECELRSMGDFTGLLDINETKVYEGDIVKVPCDTNQDFHGTFTLHEIVKVNGQWVNSYLTSETGKKLPRGYTRGFLLDNYEYSTKLFFWSEEYEPHTEIEVIGNVFNNPELLGE